MRGYLEGLKTGITKTAEKKEKYLQLSVDKANHLDELVSLLSDYSRIEQAISLQHSEPIHLIDLAETIKEELSLLLAEKEMELNIEGSVQLIVKGDSLLLRRAFENLLSNGIRYSPARGVMTFQVSEQYGRVYIRFADQGPGIKEDELEKIFKPLFVGSHRETRTVVESGSD